VRRKAARRRGDDEAEAPDKREVMRSMRRKRKRTSGMRERERERERGEGKRKGGEKPRRTLRGPETMAGKKRARRKRGNPTRALPLPYLALPALPSTLLVLVFASLRLVSSYLASPVPAISPRDGKHARA